jgi:hypothetical protein
MAADKNDIFIFRSILITKQQVLSSLHYERNTTFEFELVASLP